MISSDRSQHLSVGDNKGIKPDAVDKVDVPQKSSSPAPQYKKTAGLLIKRARPTDSSGLVLLQVNLESLQGIREDNIDTTSTLLRSALQKYRNLALLSRLRNLVSDPIAGEMVPIHILAARRAGEALRGKLAFEEP